MIATSKAALTPWRIVHPAQSLSGTRWSAGVACNAERRIPQVRRDDLIEFALEHEALTTRELAVKYTDEKRYFISESSAYPPA